MSGLLRYWSRNSALETDYKTVTRAAMTMALALLCLPTLWAGQTPSPTAVAPLQAKSTPSQHNAAQQSAAKARKLASSSHLICRWSLRRYSLKEMRQVPCFVPRS